MTDRLYILAGAAVALLPGSAAAADGDVSVKSVYQIGRCIAEADRGAAGEMLRLLPVTGEPVTVHPAQAGRGAKCLTGPLTARSITIRGAVAQAMLLRDFPRFGVPPKIGANHFAKFDLPIEGKAAADADIKTTSLYKLADCVARNQGMKIERLFRAPLGSDLEYKVVEALGPTMAACQADASSLRVSRADFRSALAQAYYNVSVRYWSGQLWSAS